MQNFEELSSKTKNFLATTLRVATYHSVFIFREHLFIISLITYRGSNTYSQLPGKFNNSALSKSTRYCLRDTEWISDTQNDEDVSFHVRRTCQIHVFADSSVKRNAEHGFDSYGCQLLGDNVWTHKSRLQCYVLAFIYLLPVTTRLRPSIISIFLVEQSITLNILTRRQAFLKLVFSSQQKWHSELKIRAFT